MARRKKGLDVHGWLVLDKPEDFTSTDAVPWASGPVERSGTRPRTPSMMFFTNEPDNLTTPIPPRPEGVAIAAIVSGVPRETIMVVYSQELGRV